MLGQRGGMRILALALLLAVPAAAARAEPAPEARSATSACLSAIIDHAPVDDVDGDDVVIRRGKDPVSCTVRVDAGEPVVVRDAVGAAIKARPELFQPARTKWAAGDAAARETFCNLPGRRAVAVVVTTSKPGRLPVLTATVFEADKRDPRCDQDLGLQTAEATAPEPTPPAATAVAIAPAVAEIPAQAKPAKAKRGWLPKIPNPFGKKN